VTSDAIGFVGLGHMGAVMSGRLVAAGFTVHGHDLSTAEVMAAGQRFGLDPEVMIDVFNRSSGQSRSTSTKWPDFVLPGTFTSGFALALMVKDMRIALGLAERAAWVQRLSTPGDQGDLAS
jgi:3-hydroxyisobutyrate dehydrogenase